MPYTDASALAMFLPSIQGQPVLTGSSWPTLDQAATIIALVSAEVDGAALAAGYAVPVDSSATTARLQLAGLVELGAGARAIRTLLPHLSGGTNDTSNLASNLERQYRVGIGDLRDGKTLLVDAARAGSGQRPLPQSNFTESADLAPGPDIEVDWTP